MLKTSSIAALLLATSSVLSVRAQVNLAAAAAPADLPNAPGFSVSSSADAGAPLTGVPSLDIGGGQTSARTVQAPKYARSIQPDERAVPLTVGDKVKFGFVDTFSVYTLAGATLSAGWSHLIDSAPHYGTNAEAFGKREGVSALRSTVQNLATESLFDPMFHDDPRYYALGVGNSFPKRVLYAASRVVVTRSDSGHNRINAPLLLGYGVAAGLNNLYYPDRDTGASQTFQSYGTSLVGAALGMEVNEFIKDALGIFHHK